MESYKLINEFIAQINSGEIDAANSIKELISSSNFKNNIATLDKIFFENKLKSIDEENHAEIISFIQDVHQIKSGNYNDFNIWSASKTHLNKTNEDLVTHHDTLNKVVGFPDNGNGLYKSFLGNKNLLKFIKNKYKNDLLKDMEEITNYSFDFSSKFNKACKNSGLSYSPQLITRYIASLATKPFVLLSGLSGSGKSKLAEAFAQWICDSEEQYAMIPVGADWTNKEPLLGYPNALKDNEYVMPDNPALDILIRAQSNPQKPYFLILDEMNLSHVERYFADFLSTMESNNVIDLHNFKDESGNDIEVKNIPSSVPLPKNLFIVGTVNIDETTYMFSPKVLDRANTIEFRLNKDHIINFLGKVTEVDLNRLKGKGADLVADFMKIVKGHDDQKKDKYILNENDERKILLINFFEELQKSGAEFGYRTAFEISKLFYYLNIFGISNPNEQLDIAIMQKLLPKLHGSRTKLSRTLKPLAKLCVVNAGDDFDKQYFNNFENIDFEKDENIKFKLSFEKIMRMYNNAVENGFASYAEA